MSELLRDQPISHPYPCHTEHLPPETPQLKWTLGHLKVSPTTEPDLSHLKNVTVASRRVVESSLSTDVVERPLVPGADVELVTDRQSGMRVGSNVLSGTVKFLRISELEGEGTGNNLRIFYFLEGMRVLGYYTWNTGPFPAQRENPKKNRIIIIVMFIVKKFFFFFLMIFGPHPSATSQGAATMGCGVGCGFVATVLKNIIGKTGHPLWSLIVKLLKQSYNLLCPLRGRLEISYWIQRARLFYLFSHYATIIQVSPDCYSFMTGI